MGNNTIILIDSIKTAEPFISTEASFKGSLLMKVYESGLVSQIGEISLLNLNKNK